MSFRAWLSVVTLIFIAVIIYFSRHELVHAWELLADVNIWILLLLIPGQILVYYAGGEMIFSYLRAKKSIDNINGFTLARMSLEMNFVNHILPSGGVSGISYMTWRLGKFGVSAGRATMSQVVRYAMSFAALIVLIALSVIAVTIDGNINRWMILMSSILVSGMIGAILGAIFLISSPSRMKSFGDWLVRVINKVVRKVTFGRKKRILNHEKVSIFFSEMHRDFAALRADKSILIRPFIWGIVFTLADVGLFLITFWALGVPINPAPILIAYGVAALAGFFVVTPGGAGAYEAIMVAFLAVAGIAQGIAIAGIVLTRVILLLGTIILGYVFYQLALIKYGKHGHPPIQR
jgi:putative heme transporter